MIQRHRPTNVNNLVVVVVVVVPVVVAVVAITVVVVDVVLRGGGGVIGLMVVVDVAAAVVVCCARHTQLSRGLSCTRPWCRCTTGRWRRAWRMPRPRGVQEHRPNPHAALRD